MDDKETWGVTIAAFDDNSAIVQFTARERGSQKIGFDIRGVKDSADVTVDVTRRGKVPIDNRHDTHEMDLGRTHSSGQTAREIEKIVLDMPTKGIVTPKGDKSTTAYVFAKSVGMKCFELGILDGGRIC